MKVTITQEEGRGEDEHSSCDMIRGCRVRVRAKIGHFLKFFIGLTEMWDAKITDNDHLNGKISKYLFSDLFLLVHAPVQCHGHQSHHPEGSVCTAMTGIEKIEEGNLKLR